jgi:hypothetical protein
VAEISLYSACAELKPLPEFFLPLLSYLLRLSRDLGALEMCVQSRSLGTPILFGSASLSFSYPFFQQANCNI